MWIFRLERAQILNRLIAGGVILFDVKRDNNHGICLQSKIDKVAKLAEGVENAKEQHYTDDDQDHTHADFDVVHGFGIFFEDGGYPADAKGCQQKGDSQSDRLSAIIITENAIPDMATISRANQEGVILLSSVKNTFTVAGMLWELGIRSE